MIQEDIILAFRDFLLNTEGLRDPVRDEGRIVMQDIVRWRVYDGRVPRASGPVAITLSQSSEITFSTINAPAPVLGFLVDLSVWAKDTDEQSGAERARAVLSGLRKMLIQYAGPLNDDVSVQTITLEGGPNELPVRPVDASGNWNFRYLTTYMLGVPIRVPAGLN